ncbi:LLM class flavin-dependent oxidoreductase [Microbacterium saperdae]
MSVTAPLRFGFQTHVHGTAPARELLPGIIDLFVAAEELGFDSGWVAQHHLGTDAGRLPSPLVLLGAAAEATRFIRLGTTVVVLPLENPLRLAEDAAVVDALSGARLELGLGAGAFSSHEFAAFGQDPQQRRTLYTENLARLEELLAGGGLPADLELSPSGVGILGRIWEAASHIDRSAETARAGRGLLLGVGDPADQRALADAYLAALAPGATPRIGAFRGAFPGEGRAERAAAIHPDVAGFGAQLSARTGVVYDVEGLLQALLIHYGTPRDVIASVEADPSFTVATDYVFAVQAASTSIAEAIRTLEVIAADIRPALIHARDVSLVATERSSS